MTDPVASGAGDVLTLRRPWHHRVLLVALGVGFGAICVVGGIASDPWAFAFVPLGPILVLDGLRTQVVVDRGRGVVTVTRAIRRREHAIGAITGVRVPPWGPIVLTLDPDQVRATTRSASLTYVVTGIYAPRRGEDPTARALAEATGAPLTGALVRPVTIGAAKGRST
ncbi:MAG TPA: hypothetical protein VF228_25865 [Iamia sp.]